MLAWKLQYSKNGFGYKHFNTVLMKINASVLNIPSKCFIYLFIFV